MRRDFTLLAASQQMHAMSAQMHMPERNVPMHMMV